MESHRMVKLIDIAKELNVSVSTVSKALNDTGRVSEKLREKIKETAVRMHYYPNESARSLKTNSTTMIGVIMPDIANIFYGKLLKEIDKAARQRGYTVIYCDSCENLENEKDYFSILSSKNVCGMIIATTCLNDFYDSVGAQENIVFIDSTPSKHVKKPFISIDNYAAAYTLTEHVFSKGYRDIMMISGHQIDTTTEERVKGFMDCVCAHGYDGRNRVIEGEHSYGGGKAAMDQILAGNRPRAIIADNNFLAYGALSSIRNHGLAVPNDIAIACFDSIDDFDTVFIKLTSINQPIPEIAQRAVKLIVDQIESNDAAPESQKIYLNYTLHEGKST